MKDIRFTGYTSLANCESEPISVPGTIQPYGVLLAINTETLRIDFCSENTEDLLCLNVKEVVGRGLSEIIGQEECDNIDRHLKGNSPEQFYTLTYRSVQLSTSLHLQGDLLLLEIEHIPDQALSLPDLYQQGRNFTAYLENSTGLRELCTHVVDEIREITGYDRVMVYRFDQEYNGEVYAESLNENIEPFLGLHYPHTDIPPQARALFARNLLRMIPDVNYEPVAVVTLIKEATNLSVDMSAGGLRSVSPIHIQYLKNMGVGASLTVSLIHNKKLWGLIACHHYSPKILPPFTRLSTKLHAHFLTSQISNREAVREFESTVRINGLLDPVIDLVNKSGIDEFIDNGQLYGCIGADGIAVVTDGKIKLGGKTPTTDQITDLVAWLGTRAGSGHYATSRLMADYEGADAIKDTASGVLFHSLHKDGRQGVLWFRGERQRTISWAGNPEKAIEISKDSLLPRKSFALWKQVVANTAADWKMQEIDAGIRLATTIQNNIFLTYITNEEKKYRLQTHRLEEVNAELNNFNYICSHDLQEPLRKIQVFSSMLLTEQESLYGIDRNEILKKINVSALRAVTQITGLLRFEHISHYTDAMAEVDLDGCLERVKMDFELLIAEKKAVFVHGRLGSIRAVQTQIEQLLNNLIGNALKFTRGEDPVITISTRKATPSELASDTPLDPKDEYVCLEIGDNGIGFDQKYAEQVFGIFFRLDHHYTYLGNGIGLAICKKIVANHNGHIMVRSRQGEGTVFYVYLKR